MKQRLLFLFMALLGMAAGAKADVVLNSTNFPDENFRKVLVNEFGYSLGQTLTSSELESFTILMLGNNGIENLTGIEYFTKVEKLECNDNKLTSLNLSKNTALKWLNCSSNQLTKLDLSKNTALTSLICYDNKLKNLDLSKNTALKEVYCTNNAISGEDMDAFVNSLPTVSEGKLQVYDDETATSNVMTVKHVAAAKAKGWRSLKWDEDAYDWVDYRGILPITKEFFPDDNFRNYLLEQDYGKDQLISDDELVKITTLALVELGIKDLSGIEYFTELTGLLYYKNEVKSLDISKNTKLAILWCAMNEQETLDVSKNTELKELRCQYNNLKTLDLSNNKKLESLYCNNNAISGEGMDALVNSLPVVSDGTFDAFHSMAPDHNRITKDQVAVAKKKGWTVRYHDGNDWTEYEGYTEESLDIEGYTLLAKKNWMDVTDEQLLWYQFANPANGTIKGSKDGISITVTEDVGELWKPMVSVLEGFDLEKGADYKIRFYASLPCDGQLQVNLGNWQTNYNQDFAVKTTGGYQVIECDFNDFIGDATDAHVLFECGNFVGTSVVWKVLIYKKGNANEDSFTKNGITYKISGTATVEVSSIEKSQGIVPIPESVENDGTTYSVTSIGEKAFKGCASMRSVIIPKSITAIGNDAFAGCGLNTIVSKINTPFDIPTSAFDDDVYNSAELIVPAGTKTAYQAKAGWSKFKTITGTDEITIDLDGYKLIAEKDWSGVSDENLKWYQFADPANGSIKGGKDGIEITVTKDVGELWLPEAIVLDEFNLDEGKDYKVVFTTKLPCDGLLQTNLGSWTYSSRGNQYVPTTGDFQQIVFDFPEFANDATDAHVLFECGNFVGTTILKKVQVYVKGLPEENEDIKISAAKQVPYCSDKNLDFTDKPELKAYVATGYDKAKGTIWLTRVKQVPANTGFLLMGEAGDYDIPVAESAADCYYKNMFKGTISGETIYTTDGEYTNYYLSNGDKGVGFYKVTKEEGVPIGANRCYLPIPTEIPAIGSEGGSVAINISAAKQVPYYTSTSLDFTSMEAQGVKAYTATGYNYGTGTIWLSRVKKVPAKTGVLVIADKAGEYSIPTTSVASVFENMFVGSETAKTIYTNEKIDGVDYVNYYLSNGDKGVGFYKVTKEEGVAMGANRCYLPIPKREKASGARGNAENSVPTCYGMTILDEDDDDVIAIPVFGSIAGDDDEATGIVSAQPRKYEQDVYYNLQGQRVNNPGKGLYIRNGKKVVIK